MPTSLIFAALRAAVFLCTLAAVPLADRAPAGFNVTGISNRILTPNGDGKNDTVVLQFDNPQFSEVTGRIYDSRGAVVASMAAGPVANTSLQWDGKSEGRSVTAGVYIYVIEAASRLYKGAVVVVK